MPLRTKLFSLFPWVGGVNTALDPSTIPPNQLVQADDVIFGTKGSRKKRDGINLDWDDQSNSTHAIIGLHDFWFGASSRTQRMVAIDDNKSAYSYTTSGTRSTISGGTAWSAAITKCSMTTLNNLCIIAVDGTGNILKKWSGSGNIADLGGTPPVASFTREHIGRLWANDKTNLDRIHYSTTGNPEEWGGTGDSGALDIGIGDGDPDGITAIFPALKGTLFVAKRTKLYRVDGMTPESFQVTLISSGIGCVAHNAVAAIDQDDIIFMSDRGVHSLAAANTYGDFEGAYLSADIQTTFNDNWTKSRRAYAHAAYLSNINSIAFALTESTYSTTVNKAIWLYNIPLKSWYRWTNISCPSMAVISDTDKKRFYLGTATTRITKTLNGTSYDIDSAGTPSGTGMFLRTGVIFPDNDPYTIKYFKKMVLFYAPSGDTTVSVNYKIDNQSTLPLSFRNAAGGDLLGVDFYLGISSLGTSLTMQPYSLDVIGAGRGIQITVANELSIPIVAGHSDGNFELQGIGLEYESGSTSTEVIESSGGQISGSSFTIPSFS